jgi:hypothetical protein
MQTIANARKEYFSLSVLAKYVHNNNDDNNIVKI